MNVSDFSEAVDTILEEVGMLSYKKVREYNPENNAFAAYEASASVGVSPMQSVVGRMLEKQTRLASQIDRDLPLSRDVLLDIIGHSLVALVMLDEGIK